MSDALAISGTEAKGACGETLGFISPNLIDFRPDINPRRYKNDARFKELRESIKQKGIIQPVVVRPSATVGRFEVIGGSRRVLAAQLEELEEIPALIKALDDASSIAAATAENVVREDMSAMEEALAAQTLTHECDGDREEARLRLGWTKEKFRGRRLLLNATPAVQDALITRKIRLGHAEQLSMLPEVTQDGTLEQVIANEVSVAELKAKVNAYAYVLADAAFDPDGDYQDESKKSLPKCNGCRHNSDRQASLFESGVDSGRCLNIECYTAKQSAHLLLVRDKLLDEVPVVMIDRDAPTDSRIFLTKRGKGAVGAVQLRACRACKNFGAVVSSEPGQVGNIQSDVCFNRRCHTKKVNVFAKQSAKPKTASPATSKSTSPKKAVKQSPSRKPVATAGTPKKVRLFVEALHRKAAGAEVNKSPTMTKVYTVLALANQLSGESPDAINEQAKANGYDPIQLGSLNSRGAMITKLFALPDAHLDFLIDSYVAAIAKHEGRMGQGTGYLDGTQSTLRELNVDLTHHFSIDRSYLGAHTKSAMASVLEEIGFDEWLVKKDGEDNAFKRMLSLKNADLIDAVLASDFDFKGKLPAEVGVSEPSQ